MTQAITGFRPGEVSGLFLEDLIREKVAIAGKTHNLKGLHARYTLDNKNRVLQKGIKTRKKGIKVKAAPITSRLSDEFDILFYYKELTYDTSHLWFHIANRPILLDSANKHLKSACKKANIDRKGRTQYCLRHSLATDLYTYADEDFANRLLGHTKKRHEYDHRAGLELLAGMAKNSFILEEIRNL